MTIFERNLEYLKKRNESLPDIKLVTTGEEGCENKFQLCTNRLGGLNIKTCKDGREYYIHSNYNPDAEASKWVSEIDTNLDLLVVFGLGLGYHIQKLTKRLAKNTRVIVVEPEMDIYRFFLENRPLEDILDSNITLIVNEDAGYISDLIFKEFKNVLLGKVDFYIYSIYKNLYGNLFDEVRKKFTDIVKVLTVNIATSEYFKKQWLANYLMNILQINSSVNGLYFKDQFRDIPAIIVSAGPSLTKNVNSLNSIKNKALILSGGSSFRILKKNNITPEFAVAIDGSPKIKDIYDGLDIQGTDLIFINRTNNEVVQSYMNKKVMFADSEDKLTQSFGKKMGIDFHIIPPDQTVAGMCVSFAVFMGCNPIILIGQDFALTGLEFHAEGAAHMYNFKDAVNNNSKDVIKTKDIYGSDTYTITSLLSSRTSMENKIKPALEKGYTFINATEGGIGVSGCVNMTFNEVIEKYLDTDYDIRNHLDKIYDNKEAYINIDNEKLEKYYKNIKSESVKLKAKSIRLNELCDIVKKELMRESIREKKYTDYAIKLNNLQQEIENDVFYKDMVVGSVEQSIAIHKIVMEDKIKKTDDIIEINLARIEFISKQMMEIAEVCTFLETFVKNVYEPIYKEMKID